MRPQNLSPDEAAFKSPTSQRTSLSCLTINIHQDTKTPNMFASSIAVVLLALASTVHAGCRYNVEATVNCKMDENSEIYCPAATDAHCAKGETRKSFTSTIRGCKYGSIHYQNFGQCKAYVCCIFRTPFTRLCLQRSNILCCY